VEETPVLLAENIWGVVSILVCMLFIPCALAMDGTQQGELLTKKERGKDLHIGTVSAQIAI
jgi:hypothetical protein